MTACDRNYHLCSRSVWGAWGEARSNHQSSISLLIKTRSKLNSISWIEYCMIVELRSCLSLFGKGPFFPDQLAFKLWNKQFAHNPNFFHKVVCFYLFIWLLFCFWSQSSQNSCFWYLHKDIWNLWWSLWIHPLWQLQSKKSTALKT